MKIQLIFQQMMSDVTKTSRFWMCTLHFAECFCVRSSGLPSPSNFKSPLLQPLVKARYSG